jgi:hypothetical protein
MSGRSLGRDDLVLGAAARARLGVRSVVKRV